MKTKNVQKTIGDCCSFNLLSIAFSVVLLFAIVAPSANVYGGVCYNVTDGGTICGNEDKCGSYDPCLITSSDPACGGSGQLEYRWLYSTNNCNSWICIPNSNCPTYNPGWIHCTTWYKREARRSCSNNWARCSNYIKKEVSAYPSSNISGKNTFCHGGYTVLEGPAGCASYLWSTGSTSRCITVNCAGTYTLTVTNSAGCCSSSSICVTKEYDPSSHITGCSSICKGQSAILSAPAGCATYLWNTGATTQCITITCGGHYSVTVTSHGGCSSTSHKYVTEYNAPTCLISGNTQIPHGGSTQLKAPLGCSSYLWSTGATTRCITVCHAGYYCVTVTNNNNCEKTCHVNVTWCSNREASFVSVANDGESIQSTVFPNPFNQTATFQFTNNTQTAKTVIEVFGIDGAKVVELFNEETVIGQMYNVDWDATALPTGLYMYRITCGNEVTSGRMMHK